MSITHGRTNTELTFPPDASVTQSALEEALASRMQDGTIGSRMSMIGQAIRSRYLPANRPRDSEK